MKTTLVATHFNIYLNLQASLHSIITVICINPYSPNKLIATKYCFLILGDDTSFFFLINSLFSFFFLFYVIISFYKNYFIFIILFLIFFFMKIIFIFSCSGMFRNVPECSLFLVLSTPRKFPALTTQNIMFHLLSNRIFRNLFLNGKQPRTLDSI